MNCMKTALETLIQLNEVAWPEMLSDPDLKADDPSNPDKHKDPAKWDNDRY